MIYNKVDFSENVSLTCYVPDQVNNYPKNRPALLILPGGAYYCCSDREAEPIAFKFMDGGVCCFVLRYSVGEAAKFPQPLIDASRAMQYIREHAEEYAIDKNRVFVIGFSAGGHLAAALGTMWHDKEIYDATGMEYAMNKPNGMILGYPVINAFEYAHKDSIYNTLGTRTPTDEQLKTKSLEYHVDEKTCPAFVFHTSDDDCVVVQNSLLFCKALAEQKIPFELHIYPHGVHGLSLATKEVSEGLDILVDPVFAGWADMAIRWIDTFEANQK